MTYLTKEYFLKTASFLLANIIITIAFAQTAIIRDKDGFVNVRKNADNRSTITDTLHNDRIVSTYPEQKKADWVYVEYQEGENTVFGYVHQSRIVYLTSLKAFKTISRNDTVLVLSMDSIRITFREEKFESRGRKLKYKQLEGQSRYLETIDGLFPWGTDGNMPKSKYRVIQVQYENKQFEIPRPAIHDLFEPNLQYTSAYLDKSSNKIYIDALNSDGAGGYEVVWVIKNGRIIHRETWVPF